MKKLFSSRVVFFLVCALFLLNRFWTAWGPVYDNSRMIAWDSYGYYLYLPATFIYDDPGLENHAWIDTLQQRYHPTETLYQIMPGQDNKWTIKYPCGMAVLWSPFFFVAHAIAEPLGYPADGLSPPYSWCILIGGIFYAFIGLWFLRKVLLHFFPDPIAAALLVLITLGTNYWQMSASETVMPHGTMFALNCVVLWLVIRWHQSPTMKTTVLLALLMGVGVLARPTQVFWLLVPLLWNVYSWRTLKEKNRFLGGHTGKLLAFIVVFTAVVSIQLAYWQYSTGKWVSYGYEERFSITLPFLYLACFSFKKGWFIYTPLMLFCFAGFYFVWKRRREIFWALAVFVFVHTWVIFSWECWWYASSFSQRGALDMYGAIVIPLGFLLVAMCDRKKWLRIPVFTLIGCCLVLCVFQTWQYNRGILHGERMTKAYYWKTFGAVTRDHGADALLEPDHWPEPETMANDSNLVKVDDFLLTFEPGATFTHDNIVADSNAYEGMYSFVVKPSFEFGPMYTRKFHGASDEYLWLSASVWVKMDTLLQPGQSLPLLVMGFNAHGRALKWKSVPMDTAGYRAGEWREMRCDMKTPISLYTDDEASCVFWHPGKTTIYLDNFHVVVMEPEGQSKK